MSEDPNWRQGDPWFLNFYKCECGAKWEDDWSCTCNDECPGCGAEVEPYKSEDVEVNS
jgi:hypothetical protein